MIVTVKVSVENISPAASVNSISQECVPTVQLAVLVAMLLG